MNLGPKDMKLTLRIPCTMVYFLKLEIMEIYLHKASFD